jgi:hypothetical protein
LSGYKEFTDPILKNEASAWMLPSDNFNANKIRSGMRPAAESARMIAQTTPKSMDRDADLAGGELASMPIQQKLELVKKMQSKKFK